MKGKAFMKKTLKRLLACVVVVMMIFAICTTAFADGANIRDVKSRLTNPISPLATIYYSDNLSKHHTERNAIFNAKKYNKTTAGFIQDQNGASASIWWAMDYRNTNGSITRAMNFKLVSSGNTSEAKLSPSSKQGDYRLVLYNSNSNKTITVKCSYSPDTEF